MQTAITIEFYILEQASKLQSWQFACTQLEKLYLADKKTYVHTDTENDATRLDALLWTFREDSFIPHSVFTSNAITSAPIQIGYKGNTANLGDTLINLSDHVPENHQQFTHIIEIVFSDPSMQQLARERFKHYRDQGHHLQTHKMKTI